MKGRPPPEALSEPKDISESMRNRPAGMATQRMNKWRDRPGNRMVSPTLKDLIMGRKKRRMEYEYKTKTGSAEIMTAETLQISLSAPEGKIKDHPRQ